MNQERQISPRIYLSCAEEILKHGKELTIPVSGGSMRPFLAGERDYVMLAKRPGYRLRPGDVVLYRRADGSYILHRICRRKNGGYYMAGDGQNVMEGPIFEGQIQAVAVRFLRKGKWEKAGGIPDWFFRHIWIYILPFRASARRLAQTASAAGKRIKRKK